MYVYTITCTTPAENNAATGQKAADIFRANENVRPQILPWNGYGHSAVPTSARPLLDSSRCDFPASRNIIDDKHDPAIPSELIERSTPIAGS